MSSIACKSTTVASAFDRSVMPESMALQIKRNGRGYVRIPSANTDWSAYLKARFDEICSLDCGWDGYNGKPTLFTNASFAMQLAERLFCLRVPPPNVVPGSDGSVQLEWHRAGWDLEIDIVAPYNVIAYRCNADTNDFEECELSADFTVLQGWVGDLVAIKQEQ